MMEQASERRALDEPELSPSELVDLLPEPRKHHKKAAISISQFGKQDEREDGGHSPASSPLSAAASKSTFYHTLANPRSVESFVSQNSEEETQHTDAQHDIQVERIAGRQTLPKTVGALLPRRLTRAQSHLDITSINKGMVIIDVSVETTTESSCFPPNMQASTAYAARPRAATVGVMTSHGGLMERAKDFARKLRRKSRA